MTEIFYARTDVPYGGGEKLFSITFSYIKKDDIHVFVNDVLISDTEYTFNTDTQILVSRDLIVGDIVSIRRITPIDEKDVVFSDTSILNKETQNLAQDQLFNAIQELYDDNKQFTVDIDEILVKNREEIDKQIADNKLDTDTQIKDNNDAINARQDAFEEKVNTDLAAVEAAAEKVEGVITNCITSMPNNAISYSGNTITLKQGIQLAVADGLTPDNKLKSIAYTLDNDKTATFNSYPNGKYVGGYSIVLDAIAILFEKDFYMRRYAPKGTVGVDQLWFNLNENRYYWSNKSTGTWNKEPSQISSILFRLTIKDGNVVDFTPANPIKVTKMTDLEYAFHEADKKYIQSVNSVKPDENGNVNISDTTSYLKTDGSSVMTGALKFEDSGYIEKNNSPSTKGLALFGDKDGYGTGASIALRSNLASGSQAGAFKLETGNNITGHTHTLQGSPDGSFTCDGKEIIRSINGEVADSTGNIEVQAGGGLEIGDISYAPYVDETKGLRRYLNGQLVAINKNTQAFLDRLKVIRTNEPTLFVDEQTWQAETLLNVDGTCDKFVIDEVKGTIRIPKYPDYIMILPNKLGVQGNGMTLGLGNNTENFGLFTNSSEYLHSCKKLYGSSVGTPQNGGGTTREISLGVTTDPTKSGIEANTNATKLKLHYFIQIATGQETKADIKNELQLNNPFTFGMYQFTDCELNNLSWLRSQGQWNTKSIYPDFYTWLLQIQSGQIVVNGVSVKLNTESYTDYDYVLNTSDETFRLPIKVKGASGKAVAGNGLTLGLTNGTTNGGLQTILFQSNTYSWALSDNYGKPVGTPAQNNSAVYGTIGITTDPTKSGIETSADGMYLYFYVGETVQNANLINAGRLEEQLNNKLDNTPKTDVVIDYQINSNGTWYRKYKSGWLEQGGHLEKSTGNITNYPLPYTQLPTIIATPNNRANKTNTNTICVREVSTTGFVSVTGNNATPIDWYACGQGA